MLYNDNKTLGGMAISSEIGHQNSWYTIHDMNVLELQTDN